MEYLKNNLPTLKLICNCTKKSNTKKLIIEGDDNLIRVLNDCVLNTLNGNINLSKKEKKRLRKFKIYLRRILKQKTTKDKKKILVQEGHGFLPLILPGAITLITALLENIIKK